MVNVNFIKSRDIIISLIIIFISFAFSIPNNKNNETNSDYWLNVKYIECLQNKLPCECENRTDENFILIIDTNTKSENFGIKYKNHFSSEFIQCNIIKKDNGSYSMIDDINNLMGSILIKSDTIYYTNTNKSISIFIRISSKVQENKNAKIIHNDKYQYQKLSVNFLNNALKKRGIPSLEYILKEKVLSCRCDENLGNMNVISTKNKSWIIEEVRDSVIIYFFVNSRNREPFSKEVIKKIYKKYKW